MIHVQEKSLLLAVKKAFFQLYEKEDLAFDPEIWKEDAGMIVIDSSQETSSLTLHKGTFTYNFDYQTYFPYATSDLVQKEIEYWPKELINPPRLAEIIDYLTQFPLSKRAIINLWEDKHRNLSMICPCTTTLFFRIHGDTLEMHTHMRANSAAFLLFMDIHFLTGLQHIISQKLNLKKGTYIHFLDSLHFYKNDLDVIHKQYTYMKTTEIWKNV